MTSALDIKGRHTLQEIVDATGIELADLLVALELPPDTDPHTAVRDLVEAGRERDRSGTNCGGETGQRIAQGSGLSGTAD